jgi:hypothetical protein
MLYVQLQLNSWYICTKLIRNASEKNFPINYDVIFIPYLVRGFTIYICYKYYHM